MLITMEEIFSFSGFNPSHPWPRQGGLIKVENNYFYRFFIGMVLNYYKVYGSLIDFKSFQSDIFVIKI